MKKRTLSLFFSLFLATAAFSQKQEYIKVHFLYGSEPLARYKGVEDKWFGGLLGGHVGIELKKDKILNFLPNGQFHIFSSKNRHSEYLEMNERDFYGIFDGKPDNVKRLIIQIPITAMQKADFERIVALYLKQTPYDYAFFGMRCGAATYEVLAQLDKLPKYKSVMATAMHVFYPKILRRSLIKRAEENGWKITRIEGSERRRWEQD
jgi:hypothetical protein